MITMYERVFVRLNENIETLEKFLHELEEARQYSEENNTLRLSPIAGLLEKSQLELLKKIRDGDD